MAVTYAAFMGESVVEASTFKTECLALIDEVEVNRTTIIVAKHGRPVAKLVPLDASNPTMGSVALLSHDENDYFSTDETWNAGWQSQ